jgi:mannosyltransferase OCH1-like enzyme
MIPARCHIVWIGPFVPAREQQFVEQARAVLEGFDVTLWRDETIDRLISCHRVEPFIRRAISDKRFAFAADAVKLVALERYGGWAIDADVEVHRSFGDFSSLGWVSGSECYHGRYAPITAVWGAQERHPFTSAVLRQYLMLDYSYLTTHPNTEWMSHMLYELGAKNDNSQQVVSGIHLMPSETFCSPYINGKSYSTHHFTKSWG